MSADISLYRRREVLFRGSLYIDTGPILQYNFLSGVYSYKNSVDTGQFIPGRHRTNPYSVGWKGRVVPSPQQFVLTGGNATYQYTYTWNGVLAAGLAGYTDVWIHEITISPYTDRGPHVLQKATAKVGASRLQLMSEFGELKETAEFLVNPFKSFRNFFLRDRGKRIGFLATCIKASKTSRGRRYLLSEARKTGSTFADTWLEMRYALTPLIYTMLSIFEEMHRKGRQFDPNKIKTKKAQIMGPKLSYSEDENNIYRIDHYCDLCTKLTKQVKFNASVQFMQRYEQTVAQAWMLSPEYFPEAVWELTRLSFVVDWVWTVQPWLQSYRVKPGIEILGNTVGRKTTITAQSTVDFRPTSGFTLTGDSSTSFEYFDESYQRTCDEDLPLLPKLDIDIDMFRTIDALSLIWRPVEKAFFKHGLYKIKRK